MYEPVKPKQAFYKNLVIKKGFDIFGMVVGALNVQNVFLTFPLFFHLHIQDTGQEQNVGCN